MDRIKPAVGNNIHQVTPGTPQALSPAPGTALTEVPGQF
ncbi:protein tyrosine kinase, partial [Pseudomonas qingdaonensis]